MPVSASRLFDWHMKSGAFERLAPPWAAPMALTPFAEPKAGESVELLVPVLPGVKAKWTAEFVELRAPEMFRDVQRSGPFAKFNHTHLFEAAGENDSVMADCITYALPGGAIGDLLGHSLVGRKLDATFGYRHRVLRTDLEVHSTANASWRVAVTGARGLVGRALVAFLESGGHDVHRMTRRSRVSEREIEFDPEKGAAHPSELEGFDAVIHLAGDPIAKGRWTEEKKRRIRDSRVPFTRRLAETLGALKHPPRVFISASAVGYYGDRGDRILRESDAPGEGFLPEACLQWEQATEPAAQAGIRVVHLRTGLVLTTAGGALEQMIPPFKLGLGGRLGGGGQWWSFIALDDLLYLIHHAIRNDRVQGALNATSPEPVTNAEFTTTLARALRRPALIPVPRFALNLVFGPMAGPLMMASARVNPEKALDTGFTFHYPALAQALGHVLP